MIRFVVGLFIFAVVLCAYIINAQQGADLPPDTAVAEVPEQVEEPIITEAPEPIVQEPAPVIDPVVDNGLGFETVPTPAAAAVRDALAILGLTVPDVAASHADQSYATFIGEALKANTSDAEITETVLTMAASGEITIPAEIVTADGQIDTATFLKAAVTTAVLVTEGTDPVMPDLSDDPAAVISVDGYDYTIIPSDSLAAIAVKFYGDVAQTSRIIQANPDALAQPAQMTAGTTISIPAF